MTTPTVAPTETIEVSVLMIDIVHAEKRLKVIESLRRYMRWDAIQKYVKDYSDENMAHSLYMEMPAIHREMVVYYVEATRLFVETRKNIAGGMPLSRTSLLS